MVKRWMDVVLNWMKLRFEWQVQEGNNLDMRDKSYFLPCFARKTAVAGSRTQNILWHYIEKVLVQNRA